MSVMGDNKALRLRLVVQHLLKLYIGSTNIILLRLLRIVEETFEIMLNDAVVEYLVSHTQITLVLKWKLLLFLLKTFGE